MTMMLRVAAFIALNGHCDASYDKASSIKTQKILTRKRYSDHVCTEANLKTTSFTVVGVCNIQTELSNSTFMTDSYKIDADGENWKYEAYPSIDCSGEASAVYPLGGGTCTNNMTYVEETNQSTAQYFWYMEVFMDNSCAGNISKTHYGGLFVSTCQNMGANTSEIVSVDENNSMTVQWKQYQNQDCTGTATSIRNYVGNGECTNPAPGGTGGSYKSWTVHANKSSGSVKAAAHVFLCGLAVFITAAMVPL